MVSGKLVIATDGASRGNPGRASIGYAITRQNGTVLAEHGEVIGRATNNEAEYRAAIAALERASELTNGPVEHLSDSQLMVRQLNGRYRVKQPHLRKLFDQVLELDKAFEHVTHRHVPREHKLIARVDGLANEALDRG